LLWLRRRQRPGLALLASGLLASAVIAWPVSSLRRELRYPIYSATTRPWSPQSRWERAYDAHSIWKAFSGSWPIWRKLDEGLPHRIAVVAGGRPDLLPCAYRYPLLGSRLQNRIFYVSPAPGEEVMDYRRQDVWSRTVDPELWVRRLVERGIDHVVALYPSPPEEAWMKGRPTRFRKVAEGIEGTGTLYQVMTVR
jgi:hypothetical protein